MRYTLRQLEYFIAVGEAGSITLASERVHISQPSISAAVSHLEQELNVQLFVRHHAQGLSLTPAGRDLLREAKSLVAQAESLYLRATEATGQVRGSLSLGCMVTLAPMLVPELTHSFTAAFPTVSIRTVERHHEDLFEGIRHSELDIALCYDLHIPDDIEFVPLVKLPPHVLMGEADPLARRPSVILEEIAAKPMILLDLPMSREYFLAIFLKQGLEPTIAARSAHHEVVRTMVANGYGYSILNATPRSDYALDGRRLVRIRLGGDHRPMTIGVATLKSLRKTQLVAAFATHCRAHISDSYIPGMVAPSFGPRRR
ncbi:LysR family transcriptional regulator [Methylobacterium terricola]|uniref:LysR family transcriptional regulator n=1 Tax=Methylobacterium terricola TaxID=2583531 RepID=A0A5C4L5S5_9HYPH|nr:LysR family transcriptional regulator [Methylobacterium terricola]TNC04916.1 LysR family transcriptional regulator [Methylobacterium terricola]